MDPGRAKAGVVDDGDRRCVVKDRERGWMWARSRSCGCRACECKRAKMEVMVVEEKKKKTDEEGFKQAI